MTSVQSLKRTIQKTSPASIPGINGGSNAWASRIQNYLAQILDLISTGSTISVFVFRPGAAAGGNVFASWTNLLGALATVSGPKVVFLDNVVTSPVPIPAGPSDLGNVLLVGNEQLLGRTPVTVADGAVFNEAPLGFLGCDVTYDGASPVATFTGAAKRFRLDDSSLESVTAPFIEFSNDGHRLELVNEASILGGSPSLEAGATISEIAVGGGSSFSSQVVAGTGSIELLLLDSTPDYTEPDAPAFTGTVTVTRASQAENSSYDDSVEDPQLNADTVQEAIDALKTGVSNGGVNEGTLTTSDATPTTIYAIPAISDGVVLVEARIVGVTDPLADDAVYVARARVSFTAGTPTVNDATFDYTSESNPIWNAEIVVVGPSAVIRVTGAAATTIRWKSITTLTTLEI